MGVFLLADARIPGMAQAQRFVFYVVVETFVAFLVDDEPHLVIVYLTERIQIEARDDCGGFGQIAFGVKRWPVQKKSGNVRKRVP